MAKVLNKALISSKRFAINVVTYKEGHSVLEHNDPMGSGRYFKFNVVLKSRSAAVNFGQRKSSLISLTAFTFFGQISTCTALAK